MKLRSLGNKNAISEVIGEMLLLAIAVTSVSVLATQFLDMQGPQDIANVTVIGKMEQGSPVFEIQRGESLSPDTKIILTLAGYDKRIFSYDEFISGNLGYQEWDIGDRIILPVEDITGIQAEATIVDTKTNSIVFWGILQDGFRLPARGKGGLWHFDEPIWQMIPNEVIDSSGNNNHGIALYGAEITTDGASNNAGFFDGFNDAVRVKTSWSLNISKSITVEAWMKPQVPEFMIDIMGVDGNFGYTPYIIHVNGDIYAIVSEDYQKGCKLSTVKISKEGSIDYIQTIYLGKSTGSNVCQPIIVQVTKEIHLVSFIDEKYFVNLHTINISANGTIQHMTKFVFPEPSDPNKPNSPGLQMITENLCAIAYWSPSTGGIIKTVDISGSGNITYTGKSITFDPASSKTYSREPSLIYIAGSTYALGYRGQSNQGILKTINISVTGDIDETGWMIPFDSLAAYEPCLINVTQNVFAVAYRNKFDYGQVKTFNVSSNGSLTITGKTMVFDDSFKCFNPCIIHGAEEFTYVIAYSTGSVTQASAKGFVAQLRIEKNGSVGPLLDDRKQFKVPDGETCHYPVILRINEHLYAISFTGPIAHTGYLITILIGQHSRGIYKGDSFMLYANTTKVTGSINNVTVSYRISLGSDWNHFALTYDGMNIRLYIDGNLVSQISYPNQKINLTKDDLYFGRFYCGYIDEVAIYSKALTQEQILSHYLYPGALE
ncbi:hypothetical protein AYK25_02435 [Thermoplasmatales archaeon SM1-50]|nr:MAG: hypothetical protein AYK25_02435 [Thermoplasmatales archaeon SM1-50]